MLKGAPAGSLGTVNCTQSGAVGIPLPEVEGSWTTPSTFPPNSPVTIARWVPGATAIPEVPADSPAVGPDGSNSGKYWNWPGALQVPVGEPGVKVAWVRSVMNSVPVNSSVESAIPVVQSSAAESKSALTSGAPTGVGVGSGTIWFSNSAVDGLV